MNKKEISETLDKYYTKREIADQCYKEFKTLLKNSGKTLNKLTFVEPSAGAGSFLKVIKENKLGLDILPQDKNIIKFDFLKNDLSKILKQKKINNEIVFLGNPPFGYKSSLAIDFINRAFGYSNYVGFILPIQFRKYSVQSKINLFAKLLLDIDLVGNVFEFMGKDYDLRSCF